MATVLEMPRVPRTDDNFIRTYTGRKFWPLNPRVEDVDIDDIAHSLSLVCRYTGHTYCFYSVAEHSLHVSHLAQRLVLEANSSRNANVITSAREVALWGLLHDASEAYLCDVPSPIKHAPGLGELYKAYEHRLMDVIAERFGLMPHEPSVVKQADRTLLWTEMRDLMNGSILYGDPLPERVFPMDAQKAEVEFMRRFEALTKAREAERIADSL